MQATRPYKQRRREKYEELWSVVVISNTHPKSNNLHVHIRLVFDDNSQMYIAGTPNEMKLLARHILAAVKKGKHDEGRNA